MSYFTRFVNTERDLRLNIKGTNNKNSLYKGYESMKEQVLQKRGFILNY